MTTRSDGAPVRTDARPVRDDSRPRVLVVLLVFLAVSATASALLPDVQAASGLPTDVLVLTQLATAVGAAAVWLLWRRRLPFPPVRAWAWRAPLLASLVAAGVVAGVLAVAQAVTGTWPPLDPATLGAPLVVVLLAQLVGAAGEEVGWRGLVQPLLETRMPVLAAGAVTGLLFGLGHLHVLAAGAGVYALFVVSAVGLSVSLAHVTAGRAPVQRVVLATALHWLVNVVILLGFSGGDASARWAASTAVATVAAGALLVGLAARGRRRATTRAAGRPTDVRRAGDRGEDARTRDASPSG